MARAMTWSCVVALASALGIPPPTAAQTFKSRVESVRLDALVLDKGQPLLGLTADDFEVRDNGVVQAVTVLGVGTLPLDVVLVFSPRAYAASVDVKWTLTHPSTVTERGPTTCSA